MLLCNSCAKDIDVSFEDFKPQLVINGIFTSDSYWEVDITNSRNILNNESSIDDVKDAHVVITDLNTLEETTLFYSEDRGAYTAEVNPAAYGSYKIEVDHPDFDSASARNDVPSKIEVVELDTSTVMFEGEETLRIDFNILDNKLEDNFYVWDLIQSDSDASDILPSSEADLYSDDSNSEVVNDRDLFGQSKIFIQDNNFNGTQYSTSFLSLGNRYGNAENVDPITGNPKDVKLQLRILTVSKELFEYLKSVETFYQSNNTNTSSVNPVDIKSNVENGLGIFGAYELTLIDIN